MRKLRLDPDQLQVQSFGTGAGAPRLGTVRANGASDGAYSECCATDNCTRGFDCTLNSDAETCYGCDVSGVQTCGAYCTDLTFCGQYECGSGGETCYGQPGTCYSACNKPGQPC